MTAAREHLAELATEENASGRDGHDQGPDDEPLVFAAIELYEGTRVKTGNLLAEQRRANER